MESPPPPPSYPDYVFDGSVETDMIYNTLAKPIVLSVMDGFNGEV